MLNKKITEVEFTIFDTETTGLTPESGDRIIEIAAAKLKNNTMGEVFQSLVNPGRPVSPAAYQVNRIGDEVLKTAPAIEEVLPRFLDFLKNDVLCSYNANFDLAFLLNEAGISNIKMPDDLIVVDILTMAKRIFPHLERHALWFVAKGLGIEAQQQHRALSDVELTIKVFNRLTKILQEKGITDFSQFSSLFALSSDFLDSIIGKKIAEIQQAIDLGVKLNIKYLARSDAQVTERLVTPKQISQAKNQAYLIGYCHLRNEERTFRVDAILNMEIV
jgi:DNA polymerase III epsilon subunit family exonuclease